MEFHFGQENICPAWDQRGKVRASSDLSSKPKTFSQGWCWSRGPYSTNQGTCSTGDPCDLGLLSILTNECLYQKNSWGQSVFVAPWSKREMSGEEGLWVMSGWHLSLSDFQNQGRIQDNLRLTTATLCGLNLQILERSWKNLDLSPPYRFLILKMRKFI